MNQPLQRLQRIFTGEYSKELWEIIENVKDKKTKWALRELGYHCQDLESQVHALENRIAGLENK